MELRPGVVRQQGFVEGGADSRAGDAAGAGFEFRIERIRFDGLDRFAEMVVVVGQRLRAR